MVGWTQGTILLEGGPDPPQNVIGKIVQYNVTYVYRENAAFVTLMCSYFNNWAHSMGP